jgi:hypothetical protein
MSVPKISRPDTSETAKTNNRRIITGEEHPRHGATPNADRK